MSIILISDIIRAAAELSDATVAEIVGLERGSVRISKPRQRAMHVAREMTGHSFPTIAKAFHRQDHTTVMNACRKTMERMETDPREAAAVEALMARFRRRVA